MSLRLASYFVLAHSVKHVLAANLGSLDAGSNKDTGKVSADTVATVGVTTGAVAAEAVSAVATATAIATAVATTKAEATTVATTKADSTKADTTAAAVATSNSVTYNQWGFVGTQKLWVATTATTETLSGSKTSSVIATVLTATSGARRLHVTGGNSEGSKFKKFAVIGGIVGVSAFLGGL